MLSLVQCDIICQQTVLTNHIIRPFNLVQLLKWRTITIAAVTTSWSFLSFSFQSEQGLRTQTSFTVWDFQMNATEALSSEESCPLTFLLMYQTFRLNHLCSTEDSPHPSYSEKYISLCFWLVPQHELFNELFIILTGPAHRGQVASTSQPLLLSLRSWESSQNNWIELWF